MEDLRIPETVALPKRGLVIYVPGSLWGWEQSGCSLMLWVPGLHVVKGRALPSTACHVGEGQSGEEGTNNPAIKFGGCARARARYVLKGRVGVN